MALAHNRIPFWTLWVPPLTFVLAVLGLAQIVPSSWVLLLLPALFVAVFASVVHAEVIALRVGEPYGTLILAFAITVIEVGLILSLMLTGAPGADEIARNTLFGVIMIVCNGVIGLCIVVGSLKHHEMSYRRRASQSALAVLIALATLTLVLPVFTTSTPGPTFSTPQLLFASIASLVLYAVFVFVQAVRHRDFFLPEDDHSSDNQRTDTELPSQSMTWRSVALLVLSLCAVVGLGKALAPSVEAVVISTNLPQAVVGVVVGFLVLLPETGAALRAAARNRLQIGINLALGSALASIGLTIPAVAVVSLWLDLPLVLGLAPKEMVLLALTFGVSILTLTTGRASLMLGAVHLVLFFAFAFLTLFP
jgi:Ca2+:H+ antiporter